MAAPSYVNAGTGATDAAGAWSYTCQAAASAGRIFIVQIFQDGTTAPTPNGVNVTGASNIENLAGTDNAWTNLSGADTGFWGVGSPDAGYQHLFIGRALSTSAPTISGTNGTSEDLYIRSYQFSDVSTGTTLATVIENSTAGNATNGLGTDGTIQDTAVTTIGPDRLALNFVAITDDNAIAAFTGESGGDWTLATAAYAESSGTDGSIALEIATITSAATINGGTTTNSDSGDGWGVVGFALIGTTPSGRQPINPAVNFQDPALT